MIETHHLSKLYSRGLYALHDLSLTVDKGEFVFLTGPSGAGKSTLLRLLLMQERPSEGEIAVNGRTLSALSEALDWPAEYLDDVLNGRDPGAAAAVEQDEVLSELRGIRGELEAIRSRLEALEADPGGRR